jgi:hypothetical protein
MWTEFRARTPRSHAETEEEDVGAMHGPRNKTRDSVDGPAGPGRDETELSAHTPLSFVVCLSDDAVFGANLFASPCLGTGSLHEVIAIRNAPSAADGLNMGFERATNELVVCVHQDVYLPEGWDRRMISQFRMAEQRFVPVGAAGVYGVGEVIPASAPRCLPTVQRVGRVVDRGRLLQEGPELPAQVAVLDELLVVVPRGSTLRFDPDLGFHLYAADLCLRAIEQGLAVVAFDALCHHNSRSLAMPDSFLPSAHVFARKWAARLPIATPCVVFDRRGDVYVLGNAATPTGVVSIGDRVAFPCKS